MDSRRPLPRRLSGFLRGPRSGTSSTRRGAEDGTSLLPVLELAQAEDLFTAMLKGEPDGLSEARASLGFVLHRVRQDGTDYLVLAEHRDHKRGRGFYIFRTGEGAPLVLQAPTQLQRYAYRQHRPPDGPGGPFRAAAWNTVPRYEKGGGSDADVARLPGSYFTAFARAFAVAWPRGCLVQIHGFDHGKQKSPASQAGMVISSGTKKPSAAAAALARCISAGGQVRAFLYPHQVATLGERRMPRGRR
ncbi:MAG: hypothetical protein MZV70_13685 [Desulfobacterales bacterium]|nr:hypothetical protein [Desulfobacterales bacterium]